MSDKEKLAFLIDAAEQVIEASKDQTDCDWLILESAIEYLRRAIEAARKPDEKSNELRKNEKPSGMSCPICGHTTYIDESEGK